VTAVDDFVVAKCRTREDAQSIIDEAERINVEIKGGSDE